MKSNMKVAAFVAYKVAYGMCGDNGLRTLFKNNITLIVCEWLQLRLTGRFVVRLFESNAAAKP